MTLILGVRVNAVECEEIRLGRRAVASVRRILASLREEVGVRYRIPGSLCRIGLSRLTQGSA